MERSVTALQAKQEKLEQEVSGEGNQRSPICFLLWVVLTANFAAPMTASTACDGRMHTEVRARKAVAEPVLCKRNAEQQVMLGWGLGDVKPAPWEPRQPV
jgi:hypothetical protein